MKHLMLGTAIVALAAMIPSDVTAQGESLSPGADIRLRVAPNRELHGDLLAWETDTLRLQDPGSGFVHALPIGKIDQLRVSQPRTRGRGALRGLLIGSIAGSLSIGVLALATEASCTGFCFGPGAAFLAGAIVGGAGGGGIGAALGAAMPGERWQEVALRP